MVKKNILNKAVENILKKHNINIVGYLDGHFKSEDEDQIINYINSKNTDILFVGMGCPKQEIFILFLVSAPKYYSQTPKHTTLHHQNNPNSTISTT